MRKSKTITDKNDIDYLLNITEDDITLSFIMKNFGEFDGKAKFHPYDLIVIPPNSYGKTKIKNTNSFTTTVGLWVYNKYFIENDLFDLFGYINEPVGKSMFGKINTSISYALLEDKITLENMKTYLMKTQKFMPFVSILSPGYTEKMLTCSKVIDKKKKELEKKYAKGLAARDPVVAETMEKELLNFAKEYLKGDPSMDCYDSGARGSFGNNFKNMFVMKGAVKNPDPNKGYDIVKSNYMDGIAPDEYDIMANSLVEGPMGRAVRTQIGGHMEKQFVSGLQHVRLDKPGSDCHTKRVINVHLTDKNIGDYMYCYIAEGSKLIEITTDNKNKYIGKDVKIRYSSLCESKTGICNKCAGNLFYRIGINNIGIASSILPSTLKNLSMKAFHNSVKKFSEIDAMKAFNI